MRRNLKSKALGTVSADEEANRGFVRLPATLKARSPDRLPSSKSGSPKVMKKLSQNETTIRSHLENNTSPREARQAHDSQARRGSDHVEVCDPDVVRRIILEKKLEEMVVEFEKIHAVTIEKERELQRARDAFQMLEAKGKAETQQYNLLLNERNQKLLEAYERLSHLESFASGKLGETELQAKDKLRLQEAEKRAEFLVEEVKVAKAHATTMEKKLLAAQQENEQLANKIAFAEREAEAWTQEKLRLQEELAKTSPSGELERLRQELAEAKAEGHTLKQNLQRLTQEHFASERIKFELANRCDDLKNEVAEVERRMSSAMFAPPKERKSNFDSADGRELERINAMLLEENINLKLTIATLRRDNELLRNSTPLLEEIRTIKPRAVSYTHLTLPTIYSV
eukprot:TRINITY_DN3132_c0_g1_i3.p1 TRINITY_DN3132_c0_g1~~TRINITY_DN3132_c0_g1_i3.p1  ORF type:complete len:399 (+),score=135.05 TRINITY_DN3132_c0_g1_i3:149-1345(+)